MKADNCPVNLIKGFGPKYLNILNKQGIYTIKDLFLTYPYRYESFIPTDIYSARNNEKTCFVGRIISPVKYQYYKQSLSSLTFSMNVNGEIINVIIFNRKYLKGQLTLNTIVKVSGKWNYFKRELVAANIFINSEDAHFETFYHIKDMTSNTIKKAIKTCYDAGYRIEEYLPSYIMRKHRFKDINDLVIKIHLPEKQSDIVEGRRRRKYEEILNFFLRINYYKSLKESKSRKPISYDIDDVRKMISKIPFELTIDQKNTCNDIFRDFKKDKPMNRIVQGDVGSGKTIVALISAYAMVTAKKQVVIMAPTEILAKQHYEYFKKFLSELNVTVGLFTGSTTKANRNILLSNIRCGLCDIIIGTHALFYEEIEYKNLGLVIIDEQHRFGVNARNSLLEENSTVDALFLSATPIPRTLGLTIFGDLDISIIKTVRQDKKNITTKIFSYEDMPFVFKKINDEVENKHQIYIVASSIESDIEEGRFDLSDISKLLDQKLPNVRHETLHGKMKEKEKTEAMERFINKEIDVLISTTVIEVGISVDNATMMVIVDAQNFGLAQLHQLRGRVGRGNLEGYCYLITNDTEKERLNALEFSNDGFYLAEMDLKLRGPGDYFSIRQSGIPDFVFADFAKDHELFKQISEEARTLFLMQDDDIEIRRYIKNIIDEVDISMQLN